jgi:hypothetical protein
VRISASPRLMAFHGTMPGSAPPRGRERTERLSAGRESSSCPGAASVPLVETKHAATATGWDVTASSAGFVERQRALERVALAIVSAPVRYRYPVRQFHVDDLNKLFFIALILDDTSTSKLYHNDDQATPILAKHQQT